MRRLSAWQSLRTLIAQAVIAWGVSLLPNHRRLDLGVAKITLGMELVAMAAAADDGEEQLFGR